MTLLVDSLRLLRARVLFWITLAISALAAVLYLSIGFNPEGFSMLFGAVNVKNEMIRSGSEYAELFYLGIFSKFVVGLWLSWVAVGLALISCAPIFPDFMSEGSIGIPLSKPVSRLTLFFSKYVGALLFVILQVGLFCVIVFIAIRWRVGTWNPSIFWAVPLVTLVFSYIYSVVVLISVWTRSVLAAILAGVVIWFVAWLGQKGEEMLYMFSHPTGVMADVTAEQQQDALADMEKWHKVSVAGMAFMPKTGETMNVMDRLIVVGGKTGFSNSSFLAALFGQKDEDMNLDKAMARNSTFYVIGSSLGFEAVMLGLAALIFCRRDY
ncbi:hypothetical protein KBB96_14030 [Luteolibacter ambystomatis]|uniref:Uncharacterized protein n=1 Tax=Luteolibacter ambystomatis TaxID=2824561 RepID=A0A975G614_9BACT|nr:hypothetical protein [Luteolibacter ambystomatis]QUE49984.1 hypothetical protein KBB96_14030 [Luteolibacter ambystomatis]